MDITCESHRIRHDQSMFGHRLGAACRECMLDLRFDRGIDTMGSLLDAAEKAGVVIRKGSYYSFKDTKLGQVSTNV